MWLVADREDTDRDDRYLRYLWTADGTFVNERMVADGFGEDLDCGDICHRRFRVLPPDPHRLDGNDDDGLGCESG